MDHKKRTTKQSVEVPAKGPAEIRQPAQPDSRGVSGELVDYYANTTHLEWTLYDLRIRFGQLMFAGSPVPGQLTVNERAAISLAWGAAKALRDSLTEVIVRYERVNGEIKPLALTPSE